MDIKGWDTVSVIEASLINSQLTKNLGQVIQTFKYEGKDLLSGEYTIAGKFGPWQVVGGSDTLIWMEIPITEGSLDAAAGSFDISGMTVTVEISLKLLPSEVHTDVKKLVFDFNAVGKKGQSGPGLVTGHSCTDPNKTGVGPQVELAVAAVLVHNADEVSFVFAEIGLVEADATWLKPVQSKYSYHKPIGGNKGYLAILSVTDNRSIEGLDLNIESDIISTKYPLSFVISSGLFLKNVVMPALPNTIHGTDANTFQFSNDQISVAHGFDLAEIHTGVGYTPSVSSMDIKVADNALSTNTAGSVDLHMPHASMSFTVKTNNVLDYNVANNTFSFQKDNNPTTTHSNHIPWYDYVLIGLSGGLALGIFAIVMEVIGNDLESSLNKGDAGGRLSNAPAHVVQWSGMEKVAVKAAGLSDAFYFYAAPEA